LQFAAYFQFISSLGKILTKRFGEGGGLADSLPIFKK